MLVVSSGEHHEQNPPVKNSFSPIRSLGHQNLPPFLHHIISDSNQYCVSWSMIFLISFAVSESYKLCSELASASSHSISRSAFYPLQVAAMTT
jgi:hypothetical protein